MQGRTTMVIAHRLSTVKTADTVRLPWPLRTAQPPQVSASAASLVCYSGAELCEGVTRWL